MNILIFGATGGTGRELVEQALGLGHQVTAVARNPEKVSRTQNSNLKVIKADVLDPASVRAAVSGYDAVIMAVGAGPSRTTVREEGTRNIVSAMEEAGAMRLICLSSLGVGESRSNLGFFTRYIVVGIFLRHAFADHAKQETVVKQSALDWTIVRPPHLKDGERTGVYQHGFATEGADIKGWITRADLADFMLKQVGNEEYLHQTPGVSY